MFDDFASQLGAFIGTSVILFIVTQPKQREHQEQYQQYQQQQQCRQIKVIKGARKYSRQGRRLSSFGMHDDFDM